MRTLSRPMFKMGGPIKEGVMHGIREPHKHGGRAALVGDPAYPKTDGREHHFAVTGTIATAAALNAARIAATRAAVRYGPRAFNYIKNWFGKTSPGASKQVYAGYRDYGPAMYKTVTTPGKFTPNWLGRDPIVQGLNWGRKAIFNPTTGGYAAKAARFATSPSSIIGGVAWYMWPDGKERKEPPTDVPLNPNLKKKKKLSAAAKKEFALEQRENRVNRYLELMGYDRAKKTAIADALIDASKIVSDRGTLDKKNITQELINPIIQAMSKRLDKPDQIREAVGLMATKAEIEKDLEDPSIKALRLEQLKQLKGGFAKSIGDFVLSAKGAKVKPKALERVARARAQEHGLDFTVVTDADIAKAGPDATEDEKIQAVVSGDGVYMIGDAIIQVTGGVPERIA